MLGELLALKWENVHLRIGRCLSGPKKWARLKPGRLGRFQFRIDSRRARDAAHQHGRRGMLRMIDLHFHDLRHEGGIRLLEKGWQLHWLQKMYGHASLAQTSKYLHADEFVLPAVMRQSSRNRQDVVKVVVQKRSMERPPLHHAKRTEASKSRPH
jgi:integrase